MQSKFLHRHILTKKLSYIMINPKDEMVPDLRASCTIDDAVAKLLGWMRGPILRKNILVTDHGISADQLPFLYSLQGSLEEFLADRRETARQQLIKAANEGVTGEALLQLDDAVVECDELIRKAMSYMADIAEELAKDELSLLKTDRHATKKAKTRHITLRSLDQWARVKYGIAIIAPTVSSPILTVEKHGMPPADIKAAKKNESAEIPQYRQRGDAILQDIRNRGHEPKYLIKNPPGKGGIKAAVWKALKNSVLFPSKKTFDHAWQKLREAKKILDIE